jgi:hypothetical protein
MRESAFYALFAPLSMLYVDSVVGVAQQFEIWPVMD